MMFLRLVLTLKLGPIRHRVSKWLGRLAGKKVTVLVKRDGGQISFRLREGMGDWAAKAPWRIEWGGGSSVENPHFQRVHYCQLLVLP
jgi:protein arginine N-methyltransferase 7